MDKNLAERPNLTLWRESLGCLCDESLHLLAKIYLGGQKTYSRELMIDALWNHAGCDEFKRASLERLEKMDTQLLLLLYLGLGSIQQLAESLPRYSCIDICLKLLHLQERLLVICLPPSMWPGREAVSDPKRQELLPDIIPKISMVERPCPSGARFAIAPQFSEYLYQKLDFCAMFSGFRFVEDDGAALPLRLNPELFLAAMLYFVQESLKRKMSKAQLARCRTVLGQLDDEQIDQLRRIGASCGLICETPQTLQFCHGPFFEFWRAPHSRRVLALQACLAGVQGELFGKLLHLWPREVFLPKLELQRLLSLIGSEQCAESIQTMLNWNILIQREMEGADVAETGAFYRLNPQLYEYANEIKIPSKQREGTADLSAAVRENANYISSNWELYCNLRKPEMYIDLLLCARLEQFDDLSLFRIEKPLFQAYFRAETHRFDAFIENIPRLESCGLKISSFIREQWHEWFNESTRFQLFEGCLLVCQSSYNETICRLLGKDILCNPQPGVFYLCKERAGQWLGQLKNAGISVREPFSRAPEVPSEFVWEKNLLVVLRSLKGVELLNTSKVKNRVPQIDKLSENRGKLETMGKNDEAVKVGAENQPREAVFSDWPTSPRDFIQLRALLCHKNVELPIHFREARGLDYNAKRNLLYSLLNARNHMAVITVAEGDDLDLSLYTVLPLNLDGTKDNPGLLALDLRQGCLKKFRVKNITRVKEVFYSLLNICLFSMLPSSYIFALEAQFQDEAPV